MFEQKGDVKLRIKLKPHDTYSRSGIDLIMKKKITMKESLCGFQFTIHHLDGKQYNIQNKAGKVIYPGFKRVVPNLGIQRDQVKGNIQIMFDVQYPEQLSDDVIKQLQNIL